MDLLRAEYASDSSATTDGTPAVKRSGNAQDSASSAPAAAQNLPDAPNEAKPAAQQSSGNSNNKSGTSTSVGNNHRVCAACKKSKSRDEYSKNQWSKSAAVGLCKTCVESSQPLAKRQKTGPPKKNPPPPRDPNEIEVPILLGPELIRLIIDRRKTVGDLKLLLSETRGLNPSYFHFSAIFRTVKSESRLDGYSQLTKPDKDKGRNDALRVVSGRHPTKAERVFYLFYVEMMVAIFRSQSPLRSIRHPSDIHDIVGTHDIVCHMGHFCAEHEINLEALPNLRMEIRPCGKDHIEGAVFGKCFALSDDRDYIKFNTENSLGLDGDEDGPSEPEFRIDEFAAANFMNSQLISAEAHEGDGETSLDYDSDKENPNLIKGSIMVLKHRAFVPRKGVARVTKDEVEFSTEEGEQAINEYNEAFDCYFIQRHLDFPESIGRKIFEFWRTEPPPCLVLKEGDVVLTLLDSVNGGSTYVIGRRNENQKPVDRFKIWKKHQVREMLKRAPPVALASYPFEEEFQRLERRKRRGLSR